MRGTVGQPPVATRIFARVTFAVDRHRMRIDHFRAAADYLRAGARQQALIDAVETLDLMVLVGDKPRPVERRLARGPAETGGVLERLAEFGRVHEKLLRDAADVDAGPAQIALLRHRHPRAVPRGYPARAHAAGARADREHVEI